ncbi:MAG TPA: pyridoxamine 5'-phosphate oxidase family protein [Deltaproteobacteria bacterium]|nr:pyridoxamine 5'-phosphate oxidase family protein [Deltaproteobacteria bacterium]
MKLSDYFENTKGKGVLATCDSSGNVNAAVYARPHFMDEDTAALIMAERLSHENLKENPHAVYLFMENSAEFVGKRLYLTMLGEEKNTELIETLRRRKHYIPHDEYYKENKYLVTFRVDKVLPLIGSGD